MIIVWLKILWGFGSEKDIIILFAWPIIKFNSFIVAINQLISHTLIRSVIVTSAMFMSSETVSEVGQVMDESSQED